MPNHDLGTAHGRIVIDFEDRGSAAAATTVTRLERQFELLNQRLASVEKSFSKYNVSIERSSGEYRKAESSSRSFAASLFGIDRITKILDKDIIELTQDIVHLNKKFNETRDKYKPLENVYKLLDRYQRNLHPEIPVNALNRSLSRLTPNLVTGENKVRSFYRALDSLGYGLTALREASWKKLYGHNNAMQSLPMWSRFVYDFSVNLTKLGVAGLAVSKALHAGWMTKFLDTNAFRAIVVRSVAAGTALERFGLAVKRSLGFGVLGGFAKRLQNSESILSNFVKKTSHNASAMSRAFNDWFTPIKQSARQLEKFVLGVGLMSSAISEVASKFMWIAKIPKPVLSALAILVSTVLPAAFQSLSKALVFTSNAFAGLWAGVQQLSGGLLVLPGLIASVSAAFATIKTIFSGLKDAFKDVFSDDPAKAAEAYGKLPEHLKPMAKALQETVKGFKEMRTELQKVAFKDIEKDIRTLTGDYLPRFAAGSQAITLALRGAKDELVLFFKQWQTKQDFSAIFSNTAQTLGTLKTSIRPVADSLKDMAVVGTQFIAELATSMEGLTQRFAEWVRVNRQSGQMMEWMRSAREGVRDLAFGTKDLVKGLWTIVTMFKTNYGTNFLDTYAKSMEKFTKAMNRSAKSGFIFDFSAMVRNFAAGSEKINLFKDVVHSLVNMIAGISPAIQDMSNAFTGMFVPSIKFAMKFVSAFMQTMHSMNVDSMIGWVLGIIAGFKLLPGVIGPAWNAIKLLGGGFLALSSAKGVVSAVTTGMVKMSYWLEKIPVVGGRASSSLMNVSNSIEGFVGKVAGTVGPITAMIVALTAMVLVMKGANDDFNEFNNQLDSNAKHAADAGKALNSAFLADNGKIGKTVLDQLSTNMTQTMQDLEDTASKAPGIMDHIGKYLSDPGKAMDSSQNSYIFGESNATNKWQKEAQDAERAATKLRELRSANINLEAVVSSSSDAYKVWIQQLRDSGENGNEAADVIDKQRKQFELYYESMQRLGPAGIQVANGIKKIAEAGGDATSKLDGLKLALQGLGFLKVDAMQAAAEYTTTLGNMADDVQQAIAASGEDVAKAFNAVDGSINTSSKLGASLVGVFGRVSNSFLSTANSGADINDLMSRLRSQIDIIAPSLGKTSQELQDMLANSFGIVPEPIKLLLQLEGKEPVAQELAKFLALLDASARDHTIPVVLHFNNETDANNIDQEIQKVLGRDITDVSGNDVVLKVGIAPLSPEEMGKLQSELAKYGIQTAAGGLVAPATMPVAPIPAASAPSGTPALPAPPPKPAPLPPVNIPINPYMPGVPKSSAPSSSGYPVAKPAAAAPQPQAMPDITPNLDVASAKVDEVSGKMRNLLANKDNKIELNTEKLSEAQTRLDELNKKFTEKKITADVEVNGIEKVQEAANTAKTFSDNLVGVFAALKDQIDKAVQTSLEKIKGLSDGIIATMQTAADSAKSSGAKFVDALAEGIGSNPAAIQAAETLASEIKKRFHQSPPKKGPLATHGDAARYGGEMFVASYAKGIASRTSSAGGAADNLAGTAVGSLIAGGAAAGTVGQPGEMPGTGAGKFLGQLLELTGFASQLVGVFQKVSETIANTMKFISDPLGKGTFFGGSLGFKKLSDAEIQKRREEKNQQQLRSIMEGGQRNDEHFQNQLKIITDAQNAVVDSKGYTSSAAAKSVGAMIKEAFPEIATIGGARPDSLPYHRNGNALDIMIPNWDTKEGRALGDKINQWALTNSKSLGITDTIWQDFWQPTGGGQGNFLGRGPDPSQGHYNHVHMTFAPGASIDMSGIQMTPDEATKQAAKSAQDAAKTALQALQDRYGPPVDPNNLSAPDPTKMQFNPTTGGWDAVTPHGKDTIKGPGPINPLTGQPYTAAEAEQWKKDNPMQIQLPDGVTPEAFNNWRADPNMTATTQQEALNNVAASNADIATALDIAKNPTNYDNRSSDVIRALTAVDNEIIRLNTTDTVGNKQIAQDLESVKSSIMDSAGYAQNANPIDTVSGIIGQAAGVASDIIGTITTSIEAIGAAKDTADVLVRGVSGTKEVSRVVDNVQKFIDLGSKIAGSVASVSGLIGSIAGAAGSGDSSGASSGVAAALGSISTVASLIQAGFETANAVIDISQEVVRIAGGYVGDFLGYLVGGPGGGPLAGNVKFLLDNQTNQLLAYSANNPLDKRTHNMPFAPRNTESRQQGIGTINVYGGPGSDPRDLTRQMMYQVNSAQYAGALSQ